MTQAYLDQPIPYDHVHHHWTSTLSTLGRRREGKSHSLAWICKADTTQFKTVQYPWREVASKVFYMINYYIVTTLLFHLQQTAKMQSCNRRKKNYNGVSILIKCFFNRDFMLLFVTKKNPTQTPIFKYQGETKLVSLLPHPSTNRKSKWIETSKAYKIIALNFCH